MSLKIFFTIKKKKKAD